MEPTQKAAFKTSPKYFAHIRFKMKRGVIKPQTRQGLAQGVIIIRVFRIKGNENHWLRFAVAREWRRANCAADFYFTRIFNAGCDIADFAGLKLSRLLKLGSKIADFFVIAALKNPIKNAHISDHAFMIVVNRIK